MANLRTSMANLHTTFKYTNAQQYRHVLKLLHVYLK